MRIISAKKPAYSLLCSEDTGTLSVGEQLRVMRLRAGLTIEQAAQAVGVKRWSVMNYELGRVKRMKEDTIARLFKLYSAK
ncbi:MAG: helix-turn-helix domain-containing protein [Lachnospiraceae bacterium]|nr:helix-turn-helix domain-containing protein [Ruminococcus sp.]MCM1277016.1 helix-turn-helix domain-containing protein [Lachnospiraceae bacterium]